MMDVKVNTSSWKREEHKSSNFLTPQKFMLDLDFLNSPCKDNIIDSSLTDNFAIWNNSSQEFQWFEISQTRSQITDKVEQIYNEDCKIDEIKMDSSLVSNIPPAQQTKNDIKPKSSVFSKSYLKSAKPFYPNRMRNKDNLPSTYNDENWSRFCNASQPLAEQRVQEVTEEVIAEANFNSKCTSMNKFTCRFDIQIPNESEFRVARKIIGYKGSNMKRIIDMCRIKDTMGQFGVKLRLRGKGSGFKEGPDNKESNDDLHLCVSSKFLEVFDTNLDSMLPYYRQNILEAYEIFKFAWRGVEALLFRIYEEYKQFMFTKENTVVQLNIKKFENNPALLLSQMGDYISSYF